ncbi:MAG: ribonuclease P protein component [Planctomycetota bacterium]|jgi:ribonuclease P protein component
MMLTRLYFRKSQRLVSEDDFRRVLSYRRFACRGPLRLYMAPNELNSPRFGVSVSRSCGNAVIRNRLKRFGREVFRLYQYKIPSGYDYILIIARKKRKISSDGGNVSEKHRPLPRYKDVESDFLKMVRSLEKN